MADPINPTNINDPSFYAAIQQAIDDSAASLNDLIKRQSQYSNAVTVTGQQLYNVRRTYQNTQRDLTALMASQVKYNQGELTTSQIRRDINKQMTTSRLLEIQIDTARMNGQYSLARTLIGQRKVNEEMEVELADLLKSNEAIDAKVGLVGSLLSGLKKIPIIGDLLHIDDAIKEMRILATEGAGYGEILLSGLGTAFNDISNVVNFGAAVVFIGKAALKADEQATGLAKSLGITKDLAADLRANFANYADSARDAYVTTSKLVTAQMELAEQTGISGAFTAKTAEDFSRLTGLIGLSVVQAGKLSRLAIINGTSISATTKSIMLGAFQAGVSNKLSSNQVDILKEVSELSAGILVKFRENPKELGKAVVQAKALGTTLGGLDKIGDSLLNWESSINAELKAELITGRQLNVEKARYAALTGDQVTLAKEVTDQVGSLYDFQKMNIIAQKSLAETFGLSREELSGMLLEQDKFNKLGDISGKTAQQQLEIARQHGLSIEDSLYKQLQQQSAQEKFNQAIEKLSDLLGNLMAGPVGQLIDGFANIANNAILLKTVMGGVIGLSFGKMIASLTIMAVELVTGAAAGIALSSALTLGIGAVAIAGGIIAATAALNSSIESSKGKVSTPNQVMNDGIIDPNAGMIVSGPKGSIQLDKNDSIIAGTNLGYGSKSRSTQPIPETIDIKPLVDAISEVKRSVDKLYNKEGNIYLDGKRVGSALVQGSYKLA